MAGNDIQLKRSSVAGRIPDAANVLVGEPVVNLADKIIFTKDGNGNVVVIGSGTTSNVTEGSNLYFTNARSIAALTEGSGINIDANGLISSSATGTIANSYSSISVTGQSNITANGESTLSIAVDGLLTATPNNVTNTVTFTTSNKVFPFFDNSSVSRPIQLRVTDSVINQVLTTVYLPFTKSDGSNVTTLRIS